MNILFLVPYPLHEIPSQRFRFEQYMHELEKKGFALTVQSFFPPGYMANYYQNKSRISGWWMVTVGLLKRMYLIFQLVRFKFVFIHREAAPIGPPVIEWMIAKVFRKKIVYDFDDAIWLTDKIQESGFEKMLRWRKKVASICRWSYKISCGNEYLAEYARHYNKNIVINPTTIDTLELHNPALYIQPNKAIQRITIGWTGSHSTLKYLHELKSVLTELQSNYHHVDFMVIADQPPSFALPRLQFVRWKKETEAHDLMLIDIGIMPLPDDAWTRGKCGFKALQFMAMEIPCVASPVGVNTSLIAHGESGILASTHTEWLNGLEKLVNDNELRKRLGKNGRKKVEVHYSVASNTSTFLSLFE